MDYEKKLKGLLEEVMGKMNLQEAAEKREEQFAKLIEDNAELKALVEKMQNQPAQKVNVQVPGDVTVKDYIYKGFDIRKQGQVFQIPEDRREGMAKFFIDAIRGKAALAEGTGSTGGYLVPDEYADEIYAFTRLNSVGLRECNVVNMASDVMRLPYESTGITVAVGNEAAALSESEPTVGEVQLTAERFGAYAKASNEFLADATNDVVSWLTGLFAEATAKVIDENVFTGGTFSGILSGASVETVTCAATGTSPNRHIQLTVDELSQAISKLASNKLMGSKFYFHRNSLHYVRIQEDTAGNKVWAQPGNGVPGTVYEYPYEIVDNGLPATPGAASGFAVFGNLKKHYIIGRRRGGMVLEVDPYGLFTNYQTRFRMVTRWDGSPILESGLVVIKTHA